jgi:hypothetical protein
MQTLLFKKSSAKMQVCLFQNALITVDEKSELITEIVKSEDIEPTLDGKQIIRMHAALVAWNSAVEEVCPVPQYLTFQEEESAQPNKEAMLYAWFTQLLKLYARQRDKQQIMSLVFEGVTASLLRDMITILYEPLAKVYKTANVYNSVNDFKEFIDDLIEVVQKAEQQGTTVSTSCLNQIYLPTRINWYNHLLIYVPVTKKSFTNSCMKFISTTKIYYSPI